MSNLLFIRRPLNTGKDSVLIVPHDNQTVVIGLDHVSNQGNVFSGRFQGKAVQPSYFGNRRFDLVQVDHNLTQRPLQGKIKPKRLLQRGTRAC